MLELSGIEMQFSYGSYVHDDNSVAFKNIRRSFLMSQNEKTHILRVNWDIEGKIIRPTISEIYTQLNFLVAAYSVNGQSVGFSGTPFFINNAATMAGVIVTGPISHDGIRGAEGVTYLRYTASLQAEYLWLQEGTILSFAETISFRNNNGGPIYVHRTPAVGDLITQQVTEKSWYYATQQGQLTQVGANIKPMDLIFDPAYLVTDGGGGLNVTYSSPKMMRGATVEYGVQWSYEFISAEPLEAYPNVIG